MWPVSLLPLQGILFLKDKNLFLAAKIPCLDFYIRTFENLLVINNF